MPRTDRVEKAQRDHRVAMRKARLQEEAAKRQAESVFMSRLGGARGLVLRPDTDTLVRIAAF